MHVLTIGIPAVMKHSHGNVRRRYMSLNVEWVKLL